MGNGIYLRNDVGNVTTDFPYGINMVDTCVGHATIHLCVSCPRSEVLVYDEQNTKGGRINIFLCIPTSSYKVRIYNIFILNYPTFPNVSVPVIRMIFTLTVFNISLKWPYVSVQYVITSRLQSKIHSCNDLLCRTYFVHLNIVT